MFVFVVVGIANIIQMLQLFTRLCMPATCWLLYIFPGARTQVDDFILLRSSRQDMVYEGSSCVRCDEAEEVSNEIPASDATRTLPGPS